MAIHRTAKIPLSRVVKMGIWDNQKGKESLSAIYKKLQAKYPGKEIYLQNCGFFNMNKDFDAIFGLKTGGVVKSPGWDKGWIGVNNKKIGYGKPNTQPTVYTDAVTGYPVLIENGVKSPLFTTKNVDNSDRGRTMLGFNDTEVIISCISDTAGTSDFTLNEELTYMLNQKCKFAINLDGGGSSQCNYNGKTIVSSRKVNNLFYIIANVDTSTPERQLQMWLNATYNVGLDVDGLLGPATNKALIKAMQTELKVDADGSWGPKSKAAVKSLGIKSKNNTINTVKILQGALCRKGFWFGKIDGKFTEELDKAVRDFQKTVRLTVDGWVGADTFTALFK